MFLTKLNVIKTVSKNFVFYFSKNFEHNSNNDKVSKLKQLRPKTPDDEYEEMFQKTMCKPCTIKKLQDENIKRNDTNKTKTKLCKKKFKENLKINEKPPMNLKVSEKNCKKFPQTVEKKELQMDALVFKKLTKEVVLEQVRLPDILRKDEVSIRVKYAVANFLDLLIMDGHYNVGCDVVVPGRELSGVVCGVGEQVEHVKAGDNVVVCPCHPGSLCRFCYEQKLSSCVKERGDGIFGITKNGAWAQFTAVPGNIVYKVDEMSPEKASLLPLLGQVMCCLSKMNISPEKHILIQGCGLPGCFFALLLHYNGHERVNIWEDNPNRVKRIPELGLKYQVINAKQLEESKFDIVISNGSGADVINKAIRALNDYGEFIQFNQPGKNGNAHIKINSSELSKRSLTIKGSAGMTVNPGKISATLANKLIDLKKLGVSTYPLKDFKQGLNELTTGDVNSILLQICKENN